MTSSQEAYIKASNPDLFDTFGSSVSLDSGLLLVMAGGEASGARGLNGSESDNTASQAGAAYLFGLIAGEWVQHRYIKASNTDADDFLVRFATVRLILESLSSRLPPKTPGPSATKTTTAPTMPALRMFLSS